MLYIASDHGGFELKKHLVAYLTKQLKKEVEDLGPYTLDPEDDYPDYAFKLGKKVIEKKDNFGIMICTSADGAIIAANKVEGIRATIGHSIENTEWARKDDDANVLGLSGKFLSTEHARAIVKKFLETEFRTDNPKYARRIQKITEFENKK
ncbi:MAG: hypothetical protein A3J93_02805 [Candidatus Magasanikbacteria bacterium RIFOXYC2_FULL_42_28]|uniref:Ribose-5-phosphate isomerase n=1 Tax=Candidatus Magasanikbacteria bacterium RIFOXYC2_FULL_42_28 TaxID=1798704 RepID=A0A1F6NU87_9BACT|nr:MAG: hypothetical protein A3J93_02805 [Candidatus Magasanikbacteria bacterium RIFOXYC2_FULL_42_28]